MNPRYAECVGGRARLEGIRRDEHRHQRQKLVVREVSEVLAEVASCSVAETVNLPTVFHPEVTDVQKQAELVVLGDLGIQGVLRDERLANLGDSLIEALGEVDELYEPLGERCHARPGCFEINAVMA